MKSPEKIQASEQRKNSLSDTLCGKIGEKIHEVCSSFNDLRKEDILTIGGMFIAEGGAIALLGYSILKSFGKI